MTRPPSSASEWTTAVEAAVHTELLRRGGLYADLWARQSGGFLASEAAE